MEAEAPLKDRFLEIPRFGDTTNTKGLKFLHAFNEKNEQISLTFRSYGETFGKVLKRYLINAQPKHPINTEYAIQFLDTHELVSEGKRLQIYKPQIQEGVTCFRIYPIQKHQMVKILSELNSVLKESVLHNPSLLVPINNITVNIKKPNNQPLQVKINKYCQVRVLKLEICQRQGLNLGQFNLIYVGKRLDNDDDTLDQYGIEDGSQIILAMMVTLGCFPPHSLISVNQKERKRVDELKRGEFVMSLNEKSWMMETDEIINVHRTMLSSYLIVTLEDNSLIQCTSNHKFLSQAKWRCFCHTEGKNRLRSGDYITKSDFSQVKIVSIDIITTQKPVQFFHISTKNNHTFFLNDFACHNMQIRLINTADGNQFLVNIAQSDTIKMLKLKVQQILGVSSHQLLIVLNKKELKNNESISDYIQDIKNCNCLEVVQMAEQTIVVNRVKTKKELRFILNKQKTVRDLKRQIQEITEIPRNYQILILKNVEMLNSQLIGLFQLDKNFNRITLVQVQDEQINASFAQMLEMKKMLYIRINNNDYLRLNYFSIREMKVHQFIMSFVPDSQPSYSLLIGQTLLKPTDYLKQIVQLPVIEQQQINVYVIPSYDRISFLPALSKTEKLALPALGIDAGVLASFKSKQAQINKQLAASQNLYSLRAIFGQNLTDLYLPIQVYAQNKSNNLLSSYLEKFVATEPESALSIPGYNYCSALMKSLQTLPPHIGEVHRLLQGVRFRQIYEKRGQTFSFRSIFSTNALLNSLPARPVRNYTILHLQSLTGRPIGIISGIKDEVVFMPYSYFYITKVTIGADYDEVWAKEVSTPLHFNKDIFMWVDDQPNSKENRAMCNLFDLSRFQLVRLTETEIAQYWMKEFGWILKWLGKKIKVMSDMNRLEGAAGTMVAEAGINLVESFHNTLGYTAPVFIFCKQVDKARTAMQARNIPPGRIQKITNDQFELLNFLGSE